MSSLITLLDRPSGFSGRSSSEVSTRAVKKPSAKGNALRSEPARKECWEFTRTERFGSEHLENIERFRSNCSSASYFRILRTEGSTRSDDQSVLLRGLLYLR